MKKIITLIAAVFVIGCNWGSDAKCACGCDGGCCDSGVCDANCGCACTTNE